VIDTLERLLAPLRRQVLNMIARAVVQTIDDSKRLQALQITALDGETREGVERFQNYGFTSVPVEGAEAAVMFANGTRGHGLVIAVDDRRYRLTGLQSGEVALYHKDGARVVLKADGSIEITAKSGSNVVLNGGSLNVARVTDTAGPYSIIGGNPHVKG
jgi:phage baseplate assembly protein V